MLSCRKPPNAAAAPAGAGEGDREQTAVREIDLPFYQLARLPLSDQAKAERLLKQMNDREIVGQLFMFGYSGKIADSEILNWVHPNQIGNIKIFGWNGTQLNEVCESVNRLQRAALKNRLGIPLFIATDQEGGWVRHIKAQTSQSPGNMAIGASPYPEDAFLSSFYLAQELSALGINMNFAPTVDIYLNKESSIIDTRSFGSDPVTVGNLSIAFLKGHEACRVVATAKHYPGHGNSKEDSHGRLPQIFSTLDFIQSHDLVPYRMLIRESLPAIMSGHISFPNITRSNEPATLSPTLIHHLLREELGYDGIVVTDDLNMAGMRKEGVQTGNKSLEALKAGNDMVLISKQNDSPRQYQIQWEKVFHEYQTNPSFQSWAKQSCLRILKTKFRYLPYRDSVPLFPKIETVEQTIPSPEATRFFFNQSCRAVTRLTPKLLPLSEANPVLLVGYYLLFFKTGREAFPRNRSYNSHEALKTQSPTEVAAHLSSVLAPSETLVVEVLDRRSAQLARALIEKGQPVYFISTLMPGYAVNLTRAVSGVGIYATGEASFQAAFAALKGQFDPIGRLPFR